MSDSVQPHPWDSPGKNTGVGCHFLVQCIKVKSESEVVQSCPTLATPWTAAYQAPLSMGFSRQESWSGVPLPSPNSYQILDREEAEHFHHHRNFYWTVGLEDVRTGEGSFLGACRDELGEARPHARARGFHSNPLKSKCQHLLCRRQHPGPIEFQWKVGGGG